MCLYVPMEDGLQENKVSGCSEGQLHKQLCLRICGFGGKERGETEKKKKNEAQGVIKKKKQQATLKLKKWPVLTADFQTTCPLLIQTAIKHNKFLNVQRKTKKPLKIAGLDWIRLLSLHGWKSVSVSCKMFSLLSQLSGVKCNKQTDTSGLETYSNNLCGSRSKRSPNDDYSIKWESFGLRRLQMTTFCHNGTPLYP